MTATNPGESLSSTMLVSDIKQKLHKLHLIDDMTAKQQGPNDGVVKEVTHRQQLQFLKNALRKLHPADVAFIVESLPPGDRELVWQLQAPAQGAEILLELPEPIASSLIVGSEASLQLDLLEQLDADDIAYIGHLFPEKLFNERLEQLAKEEQRWIKSAMDYPAESAGSVMRGELILAPVGWDLNQVRNHLRSLPVFPQHTDSLAVISLTGHLVGILPLEIIITADPDARVGEVMKSTFYFFNATDSLPEVASAFHRYDLISAPLVNDKGRPVGRLTVDDILDYVRDEFSDDALNAAGIESGEDLFASIWRSAKNRWVWLSLSLLTAMTASRVIGLFEDVISAYVALAALMPIVAAIGGNTGNQTATLVVRGLALGQIDPTNRMHLIRKEMSLSLLNGFVWGSLVALFAFIFYANILLSLVILGAMLITLFIAAVLGLAIPLTLQAINHDPALGAGVLVTALTDSLGFFIFLSLSALFLV